MFIDSYRQSNNSSFRSGIMSESLLKELWAIPNCGTSINMRLLRSCLHHIGNGGRALRRWRSHLNTAHPFTV